MIINKYNLNDSLIHKQLIFININNINEIKLGEKCYNIANNFIVIFSNKNI